MYYFILVTEVWIKWKCELDLSKYNVSQATSVFTWIQGLNAFYLMKAVLEFPMYYVQIIADICANCSKDYMINIK